MKESLPPGQFELNVLNNPGTCPSCPRNLNIDHLELFAQFCVLKYRGVVWLSLCRFPGLILDNNNDFYHRFAPLDWFITATKTVVSALTN